jgi:hypothetical protein
MLYAWGVATEGSMGEVVIGPFSRTITEASSEAKLFPLTLSLLLDAQSFPKFTSETQGLVSFQGNQGSPFMLGF